MQSSWFNEDIPRGFPEDNSPAINGRRELRIYDVCDPVDGLGHAMIDSRLTWLRAGITGGDDADEIPSTGFLQHQWAAAVALEMR